MHQGTFMCQHKNEKKVHGWHSQLRLSSKIPVILRNLVNTCRRCFHHQWRDAFYSCGRDDTRKKREERGAKIPFVRVDIEIREMENEFIHRPLPCNRNSCTNSVQ